jgi:hypothetical protein
MRYMLLIYEPEERPAPGSAAARAVIEANERFARECRRRGVFVAAEPLQQLGAGGRPEVVALQAADLLKTRPPRARIPGQRDRHRVVERDHRRGTDCPESFVAARRESRSSISAASPSTSGSSGISAANSRAKRIASSQSASRTSRASLVAAYPSVKIE